MIRKTILVSLISFAVMYTGFISAKEKDKDGKDTLMSQQLIEESGDLDKQILNINKNIQKVIADNNFMSPENKYKLLPYQTAMTRGKDFFEIVRHRFIRSTIDNTKIIGIMKKSVKVYTGGSSVSKIESMVYEKRYDDESVTVVNIVDPSPNSVETKDIRFAYKVNGRLLKDVRMGKIQNTTAFPIQNDLKRNFLIPHLNYFYSVILSIAETYKKGIKDSESLMADFLKDSTSY